MKKDGLLVLIGAVILLSSLYFAFGDHTSTRLVSSAEVQLENTPTIDEQWSKVTMVGEWFEGKSSFVFQEDTLPYTYRLRTDDPLVGCAVTPVYQSGDISGMMFGVVIFEESTGSVAEIGYTTVNNAGKVLSAPIAGKARYKFNTACKQHTSKLPSEIEKYIP